MPGTWSVVEDYGSAGEDGNFEEYAGTAPAYWYGGNAMNPPFVEAEAGLGTTSEPAPFAKRKDHHSFIGPQIIDLTGV